MYVINTKFEGLKIIQQKKIIKEFSKDNEIKHIKSFLKYFN